MLNKALKSKVSKRIFAIFFSLLLFLTPLVVQARNLEVYYESKNYLGKSIWYETTVNRVTYGGLLYHKRTKGLINKVYIYEGTLTPCRNGRCPRPYNLIEEY